LAGALSSARQRWFDNTTQARIDSFVFISVGIWIDFIFSHINCDFAQANQDITENLALAPQKQRKEPLLPRGLIL